MAERREPIDPGDIVGCRIFFVEGQTWIIGCDHTEINRIVDELVIFEGNVIKARFNINKIAGYQLLRKNDPITDIMALTPTMACRED